MSTKRGLQFAAVLVLVSMVAACASTGTGNPVVVRAEDVLKNSLSTYKALMKVHRANSTHESPALYKAIESVHARFPAIWRAANKGKKAYKAGSINGDQLNALLDALQSITDETTALRAGGAQ